MLKQPRSGTEGLRRFLGSFWFSVHIGRLKKLGIWYRQSLVRGCSNGTDKLNQQSDGGQARCSAQLHGNLTRLLVESVAHSREGLLSSVNPSRKFHKELSEICPLVDFRSNQVDSQDYHQSRASGFPMIPFILIEDRGMSSPDSMRTIPTLLLVPSCIVHINCHVMGSRIIWETKFWACL